MSPTSSVPIYWCNAQHEMYLDDNGGWVMVAEYEKLSDKLADAERRLAEIAQIIEIASAHVDEDPGVGPIGRTDADRIYRLAKAIL